MRVDMQESQSQSWNNTALFRLLPVRNWTIASTGINPSPFVPTGVREEAEFDCVAEGFITSVSHEPRRAAAAFTDCVVSLQAFHTVKLPTVFRQETLPGFFFARRGCSVSENPSHAQTQTSPRESWALQVDNHHGGSLEGFQPGWKRMVWKQWHWRGEGGSPRALSGQSSRLSWPCFRLSPLDLAASDLGCK